jgi:hypothetical protein
MAPRQQWRAKVVSKALKETRVEAAEGRGVTDAEVQIETEVNWFDRPATPVGLVNKESAQDRSEKFWHRQEKRFWRLLRVVQRAQCL